MGNPIDKLVLQNLYIEKQLSMRAIADQLKRSEATVYTYLKKYGIKSRPQHQLKGRPKSAASIEKQRKSLTGYKHSDEYKKNLSEIQKGKPHPWNTGRRMQHNYIQIWEPTNPMANKTGYVYEHRKVMSDKIGRPLLKTELVHHVNGIKTDNRVENLEIVTRYEHAQLHSGRIQCPHCLEHFRYVSQINSARGNIS